MEEQQYYRTLTRNMVLTMILVSLAPLILISGIGGYYFHTAYRSKVLAQLQELVEKHQQSIDGFLHERLRNIGVQANSWSFEQLCNETFLQQRLALLQSIHGSVFVDLGVVDEHGTQISYAGPFQLRRANYADTPWFKDAIASNYLISDVFLGLRRQPHFIVTVRRENGGKPWILKATIDFEAFNRLVGDIRIGETGLAFLLNRDGEYQTKPRSEPAASKDFFLWFLKARKEWLPAPIIGEDYGMVPTLALSEKVTGERAKVVEETTSFGRSYIYVMTLLKSDEWILVYQQDAVEAFSELYHARNLAIGIFLLGGLAIAIKALVLSRRMVRRIEQADRGKEMMNEQVIEAGKLASVGELAAGIAHEINNPIAVMVEEAGWIQDLLGEQQALQGETLEEMERALKQIRTQGVRCKEITHKLLSFARKTDPNVREVQLNDLIGEIISLSEQRARYGKVKITANLMTGLPTVSASPSEMQQVFLNLVNNAVDAIGPKGGTLTITSRIGGGKVVIDVADNGQGIPQSNLVRIFDPFFTTKPVGKGTGLGLSICYGIVKKLGGDISVNSAVGMGTTFHVHLPCARPEECPAESEEPAP